MLIKIIHRISKLPLVIRLLWIFVLFYIWIKIAPSTGLQGNSGLFISTVVLAFLAFVFLLPRIKNKKNND